MLAFILSKSKMGCNAFLGGIAKNFKSNLVIDSKSKESLPFVHIISAKAKAVSDIEGNYTLRIPLNTNLADSIKFSVIGYSKKS